MLIDWYRNKYRRVVRETLREEKAAVQDEHDAEVAEAIQFFNRQDDVNTIQWEMVRMFATRAVSEDEKSKSNEYADWTSSSKGYWNFERGLDVRDIPAKRIMNGQIEAVNTGLGSRMIEANATQFTQPNRLWTWISGDDKEKNLSDVESLMKAIREESGFSSAVTQWDRVACMVESAWLHVYFKDRELRYDVVQPQNVWIKFGNRIVYEDEAGNRTPSWVDHNDIEDASAVIVRLATDQGFYRDKSQYLAYVGCCDDWPEGRYVVYTANKPWPIPDSKDPSQNATEAQKSIEYEHMERGNTCNPLTWLRHHGTDEERSVVTTEYPLVLFRGGHQVIDTGIAPTMTSLFHNCKQLEIAWSRVLRYALMGARGVDVWIEDANEGMKPPTNNTMVVVRGDNADFKKTGWPASNSKDATQVVSVLTEQVGGGYHVPGYFLLGQKGAVPASGIALALQIQPLIDFRQIRTSMNEDEITRLFEVERAQLVQQHSKDVGELLRPDIRVRYHPGKWTAPGDPLINEEARTLRMNNGVTDLPYEVMDEHNLSTIDEARKLIKEMQERDPGYQGGKKKEPPPDVLERAKFGEEDDEEVDDEGIN